MAEAASRRNLRPVQADILRAVVTPKVCYRAAHVLRAGSGGDEATFNLSQPCEHIDVFLSHSWRDSGLLKYLAICMHFNAVMAFCAATAASLFYLYLQRFLGVSSLPLMPVIPFMNIFNDVMQAGRDAGFEAQYDPKVYTWWDTKYNPLYSPSCQVVATTVFLLVFLFGHNLRPAKTMFLDKVCIHQTDAKKKAAGIQAIDQFIHRSSTMLIMYNDDYFERLWCCFELAARASENAHIVMLPLWRAPCVLAIAVGFTIAHVAEYYCIVAYGVDPPPPSFYAVSITFHLLPMLFMFDATVRATRQKTKLAQTLRTFKVTNTKCFDPKDRVVVEKAISSWFSSEGKAKDGVDAKAIERFELDVREGKTNAMIRASIGNQPGLLRMRELLIANLIVWIPTVCDFAAHNHAPGWIAGLAWNAPLFSVAFMVVTLLCNLVLGCCPRFPSWLLTGLLFVVTMAVFIPIQFVVLVAQFFVCGPACIWA